MADIINWEELSRGYADARAMCQAIYKDQGSYEKASNYLGMSVYSFVNMLKSGQQPTIKVCRHCGMDFEIEPRKYRDRVCKREKCKKLEKERLRLMRAKNEANRRHKRRMKEAKPKKQINKNPCKKCGGPMPKSHRYYCKDCWASMPSSGLDEFPHALR